VVSDCAIISSVICQIATLPILRVSWYYCSVLGISWSMKHPFMTVVVGQPGSFGTIRARGGSKPCLMESVSLRPLLILPLSPGQRVNDPRKPLRYPFASDSRYDRPGDPARLDVQRVNVNLAKDLGFTHSMSWRLTGQMAYESFNPGMLIVTLENQKLSSLTLEAEPFPPVPRAAGVLSALRVYTRQLHDR